MLGNPRIFRWHDAFLGPEYSEEEISSFLGGFGITPKAYTRGELLSKVSEMIAQQQVIGWYQGRMEYGPRALGSRSIIADARNPENWKRVNLKIKFRESFRPFAPTVLEDRVGDYFEWDRPSPYMLFVAQVRADKRHIPAITHVDGSARLQTISRDQHSFYYDLIREFERRTGCPVIINTSFNVRGEPIVCTPLDAFTCFMNTDMDVLVMGPYIIEKSSLPAEARKPDLRKKYEPD